MENPGEISARGPISPGWGGAVRESRLLDLDLALLGDVQQRLHLVLVRFGHLVEAVELLRLLARLAHLDLARRRLAAGDGALHGDHQAVVHLLDLELVAVANDRRHRPRPAGTEAAGELELEVEVARDALEAAEVR